MLNAVAPKPSTVAIKICFIRSSLADSDSQGSTSGFSKYLHVAGAALLHGIDALHRLLDLAHHGKLLAHFEKDLEAFGEFLGSIVGLGQTGEHFRVIGFDLVLVALVAPRLHVGDGARVVLLPEIVAAVRKVEPLVPSPVTRLGHLADAREHLAALGLGVGAAEHDVGQYLRVASLFRHRGPGALRFGAPALAVSDQRLTRQCALAVLGRRLRLREEGLHVGQRLVVRAQTAQYLGEVVFRARLHARVGGGPLELTPRQLAIEPRQVREQGEIVEVDAFGRTLARLEPLDVGSHSQVGGAGHGKRLVRRAGRGIDLDEIAPRARRQLGRVARVVGNALQGFRVHDLGAALGRCARQRDLRRRARCGPHVARPLSVALFPQGAPEPDAGDRAVAAFQARVGSGLLEVASRSSRASAREQGLGEVQPRVAAAVPGAGLQQFVEIVELGRGSGAGERLVQVGVAQVNHAEHQLRLRAALGIGAGKGVFEHARRLLVAALFVELHRRIHRVVGAVYRRARDQGHCERYRERGGEQTGGQRTRADNAARHGVSPLSFARYTWSHWSTWARNAITPLTEQVTSWFILVPVRTSVLVWLSTSAM